jgi:outer membrane protein assembly factor BamB/predicted MPP superfamily phosphohydrolase
VPAGRVLDRDDGSPIAAVVVSDGLAVTRSSDDGTFSLPDRADAEFVWACVPSTHCALEPGWFVDVRDDGSAPVDLVLARRREPVADGCRFVQVTDVHVSVDDGARLRPMIESNVVAPPGIRVTGEVSGAEFREDLEAIVARERPDFIAATGDLADYGQPEELVAYRAAITGLGVPVASVPGNHDHLSVLVRDAIDTFFREFATRDNAEGLTASDAFQHEFFRGDWRRPNCGRAPWLDVMGPLYYSFDWGGVHVVMYDGEGRRRYGDDYPQDEWLAADLATVAPDTPVFVGTHFPETREFFRARFGGVRLVGSISGHWHGTRVWHDGEAAHWTSSTTGFGGIDFTPRGYRVIAIDGSGARSHWVTMEAPTAPDHARVTGRAAVLRDGIAVSVEHSDGRGAVRVIGGWTHDLPVAPRGGVVTDGTLVFATDLAARLVALDTTTGALQWAHDLGDPSVRWNLGVPVVRDGRVYAGSAMSVHAFAAGDGTPIWTTELAPEDWAASWAGITADADTVVIAATNDHLDLAALDAEDGTLRWRHGLRDIAGVSTTPAIAGPHVLAARAPGWLAAYSLADGTKVWEVPLDDAWPVALAVAAPRAFVRSATGRVTAHELDGGALVWECALGPGVRAGRPYSRVPGGARVPLVVVGNEVWTAEFDAVVALDCDTGAVAHRHEVGAEIVTITALEDRALAVTADAQVVPLPVG